MMRASTRCRVDTRRNHAGPSLAQRTITGVMAIAASAFEGSRGRHTCQ
jgi:hypothetical protein